MFMFGSVEENIRPSYEDNYMLKWYYFLFSLWHQDDIILYCWRFHCQDDDMFYCLCLGFNDASFAS